MPEEAIAPEVAYQFGAEHLTRANVAQLYIDIILDKAMMEVQDWLLKEIGQKGLHSLYPILEGRSLLMSMAEFVTAPDEAEQANSPK